MREGAEPVVTGAYPKFSCRVCKIHEVTADVNGESGLYSGSIVFGRNQCNNSINETDISKYRVYLGDSDGHKLNSRILAEVDKQGCDGGCDTCCAPTYTASIFNLNLSLVAVEELARTVVVLSVDMEGREIPFGTVLNAPFAAVMDLTSTSTTTNISNRIEWSSFIPEPHNPLAEDQGFLPNEVPWTFDSRALRPAAICLSSALLVPLLDLLRSA